MAVYLVLIFISAASSWILVVYLWWHILPSADKYWWQWSHIILSWAELLFDLLRCKIFLNDATLNTSSVSTFWVVQYGGGRIGLFKLMRFGSSLQIILVYFLSRYIIKCCEVPAWVAEIRVNLYVLYLPMLITLTGTTTIVHPENTQYINYRQ